MPVDSLRIIEICLLKTSYISSFDELVDTPGKKSGNFFAYYFLKLNSFCKSSKTWGDSK